MADHSEQDSPPQFLNGSKVCCARGETLVAAMEADMGSCLLQRIGNASFARSGLPVPVLVVITINSSRPITQRSVTIGSSDEFIGLILNQGPGWHP
jgi:hypothetical protein